MVPGPGLRWQFSVLALLFLVLVTYGTDPAALFKEEKL
jgi:hypothetical protein